LSILLSRRIIARSERFGGALTLGERAELLGDDLVELHDGDLEGLVVGVAYGDQAGFVDEILAVADLDGHEAAPEWPAVADVVEVEAASCVCRRGAGVEAQQVSHSRFADRDGYVLRSRACSLGVDLGGVDVFREAFVAVDVAQNEAAL